MRTLKIVSVLLGAAAAPPTRTERLDEHESQPRTRLTELKPVSSWELDEENRGATHGIGREAEIPLAAAYPTQAARAALLDACLARAGEHRRLSTVATVSD